MKNLLITGGAGFIGSHLVRLMVNKYPEYRVINLDKLTAGNLANLKDVEKMSNYKFVKADICDFEKIREIFTEYEIDGTHFPEEPSCKAATRLPRPRCKASMPHRSTYVPNKE